MSAFPSTSATDPLYATISAPDPNIREVVAMAMEALIKETAQRKGFKPRFILQALTVASGDVLQFRKWTPAPSTMSKNKWGSYFAERAPEAWEHYGSFLASYMSGARTLPLPEPVSRLCLLRDSVLKIIDGTEWYLPVVAEGLGVSHRFLDQKRMPAFWDLPSRLDIALNWPPLLSQVSAARWLQHGEPVRAFVKFVLPFLEAATAALRVKPEPETFEALPIQLPAEKTAVEQKSDWINVVAGSPACKALGQAVRDIRLYYNLSNIAMAGRLKMNPSSYNVFVSGAWPMSRRAETWKRLILILQEEFQEGFSKFGCILLAYDKGEPLTPFIDEEKKEEEVVVLPPELQQRIVCAETPEAKALGAATRAVRKLAGWRQAPLARQLGWESTHSLSTFETGGWVPSLSSGKFDELMAFLEKNCAHALQKHGAILSAYRDGKDISPFVEEWRSFFADAGRDSSRPIRASLEAKALGAAIRDVRERGGYSRADLAALLHVKYDVMSAIEKGAQSLSRDGKRFNSLMALLEATCKAQLCENGQILLAFRASQDLTPFVEARQQALLAVKAKRQVVLSGSPEAKAIGHAAGFIRRSSNKSRVDIAATMDLQPRTILNIECGGAVPASTNKSFVQLVEALQQKCPQAFAKHGGVLLAYRDGQDLTPFIGVWKKTVRELKAQDKALTKPVQKTPLAQLRSKPKHVMLAQARALSPRKLAQAACDELTSFFGGHIERLDAAARSLNMPARALMNIVVHGNEKNLPSAPEMTKNEWPRILAGVDACLWEKSVALQTYMSFAPRAGLAAETAALTEPEHKAMGDEFSETKTGAVSPFILLAQIPQIPAQPSLDSLPQKKMAEPAAPTEPVFSVVDELKALRQAIVIEPVEIPVLPPDSSTLDLSKIPEALRSLAQECPDAWLKHGADLMKVGLALPDVAAGAFLHQEAPPVTDWRRDVASFVAEHQFGDGYGAALDCEEFARVLGHDPFAPLESYKLALDEVCQRQGFVPLRPQSAAERDVAKLLNQYKEIIGQETALQSKLG